jgi:hypothetical protein
MIKARRRRTAFSELGPEVKTRRFRLKEIPRKVDALFRGEAGGWVVIAANALGRACVELVFPEADIAWRDPGDGLPADWFGFSVNLRQTVSATTTRLPAGVNPEKLNDASPYALASFLAVAVRDQGARIGLLRADGTLEIFD